MKIIAVQGTSITELQKQVADKLKAGYKREGIVKSAGKNPEGLEVIFQVMSKE